MFTVLRPQPQDHPMSTKASLPTRHSEENQNDAKECYDVYVQDAETDATALLGIHS